MARPWLAILFTGAVMTSACDLDPFGAAFRPVAGRCTLEEFESGTYTLHVPESTESPNGELKGVVRQLAWDSTTILVERDSDYVAVDVGSGWVKGPLKLADARREPLFAKLAPAGEVWHHLPRW